MRSRDWFSVGLRLLGAWLYYRALQDLMYSASWLFGINPGMRGADSADVSHSMLYNLMYAVGSFALGNYFLFGAEGLTRRSFNEPTEDDLQTNPPSAQ